MRSLGASMVLGSAGLWLPRNARAGDISLSDRIDLLYSNQFHFTERGEPQITIGLMQGQTEVLLTAPGGLSVLPSGGGGTAVEGGTRWRIRLGSGKRSHQRYAITLESLSATDARAIGRASKTWQKRGFSVKEHEVGALFGVNGTMLDTRRTLLTTGDYASEAEAEKQARVLKQRFGALGRLHPTIERRGAGTVVAEDLEHGVRIRAEGVLWFAPKAGEAITVHDVLHNTTIGKPSRETRSYRGQIYVAVDRFGKLSVVNLVSETDILSGLVPAEIFASAPSEALKAQSVAARGQLLTKLGTRHLDDPFLVCGQQHCQVYAGKGREHPRTNAAVRATTGRVLMRPDLTRMVDTVYSANSGGHTEDNDVVWPSPVDAQLRGRPDPLTPKRFAGGITEANIRAWVTDSPPSYSKPDSERLQSAYRWQTAIDPAAIAGNPGIPKGLGDLKGLEVLRRGPSGRAVELRLTGARGEILLSGELKIRRALGSLKSSMFVVEAERDRYGRFVLHGGGHGHGVGMCQHGAMGMARAGKSYGAILAQYYAGSRLKKMW
jgi:peptidoglycan hydrolase-like amidase